LTAAVAKAKGKARQTLPCDTCASAALDGERGHSDGVSTVMAAASDIRKKKRTCKNKGENKATNKRQGEKRGNKNISNSKGKAEAKTKSKAQENTNQRNKNKCKDK
jgi:hypothetical protein